MDRENFLLSSHPSDGGLSSKLLSRTLALIQSVGLGREAGHRGGMQVERFLAISINIKDMDGRDGRICRRRHNAERTGGGRKKRSKVETSREGQDQAVGR